MKNQRLSSLVTNLPPCTYALMCCARHLPSLRSPRRPRWWFRWQFTRLLNEGLPSSESVQRVIGLHARLPEAERRAYEDYFRICRRRGLTEEQIALLLLLRMYTEPHTVPA